MPPFGRLLTDHIDALREATRLKQTRHPFTIDAMVVLPDHIHAVWTLPDARTLSTSPTGVVL